MAARLIVGPTYRKVNYAGLAIAAVSLVSLIIYLPTLGGYWISDDFAFVVPSDWAQIAGFFNPTRGGFFYRPISWLVYAVNWQLWGDNPAMWHVTNIVLHVAVVLMLWLLVRTLSNSFTATLAALFFAVHPSHPAAVAWVSALPDLSSTLLYIACVFAFVRFRQSAQRGFYALALILLVLAILSKESGITAPAILILVDLLYFTVSHGATAGGANRLRLMGGKLRLYAPFVAISGGYLLLRLWLNGQGLLFFGYTPVLKAIGDVYTNTAGYVAMAIGLPSVYSPYAQVAAALFLIILVVYTLAFRHEPLGWLGFGWLLVNLVPVLNITVHDDNARYGYLPSVGICLVLAVMVDKVWHAAGKKAVRYTLLAASTIVVSYGLLQTNELNNEWLGAGDISQTVLTQIKAAEPRVPPGSEFFIANQPIEYKRTLVLFVGMPEAIKLVYKDNTLRTYALNINPARFHTAIQRSSSNRRYYFAYVEGRMVEFPNAQSLLQQIGP